MESIRIYDDLEQCRFLWQEAFGNDSVFHLWETRNCFQDAFDRVPCFIAYEDDYGLSGLLPLSHINESGTLAFFPGETWNGRTWLEQNCIFARSPEIFYSLLEAVPNDTDIRYLERKCLPPSFTKATTDEVGYFFFPSQYAFSFQAFLNSFSPKKLKRLNREPNALRNQGVKFRYNCFSDIDQLYRINIEAFGENSYFHDELFLNGFDRFIADLDRRGALRVTTVLVAGEIAAVDVGALWRNVHTVLAGGTNRDFPGVAKLMNFHHLEFACYERFNSVDFLCGDFGWKRRLNLVSRPLYQVELVAGELRECYDTVRSTEIIANV